MVQNASYLGVSLLDRSASYLGVSMLGRNAAGYGVAKKGQIVKYFHVEFTLWQRLLKRSE